MNFKTLPQLLDFFKDEATCKAYLEQQRWNGLPTCPFCLCEKVYRTNRGFKCADKSCNKKFTVTVGTIYENSKVSLRIWFAAMYLITSSKKGVSSLQLHRQLGVTQKTAWFILHRVREMLKVKSPSLLQREVQIDETYIGGKEANKHASKKLGKKAANESKTAVIGLIETGGRVAARVTPWVTKKAAEKLIEENVDAGAIMVTDSYPMYNRVGLKFDHVIINHSKGIYKDENGFHTNSIENFWSLLKRGIYGIYHQVSPKHLQRYCDGFAARFNSRKIADNERFDIVVKSCEGRLKYEDLIS